MKFQIKHRYTNSVLFELEADRLVQAVEAAVKSRANLTSANLTGANLTGANLTRANLTRANLYGADLYGANLTSANLTGANLTGADLTSANLTGANLTGANLTRANLYRANLTGANLYGANLYGADLYGANLYGANLTRANLYGADLTRADLYGANLTRANLYGANLTGANLYGADLYGANLTRAKGINPYRCTPLLILKDQPGPIRAYKLINADDEGPYRGGIDYLATDSFHVDANMDVKEHCGAGIDLATLDWCMREWMQGYRILIMEFTAKRADGSDNICIPTATDGKFRVTECKRVGEVDLKEIGLIVETETKEADHA